VERQRALEAALEGVDRLPAKERALVRAWKLRTEDRPDEALRLLAPVAEEYPRDKEIQLVAGWAAGSANGPSAAEPWFERALALDPGWGLAMSSVVWVLSSQGRHDEAIARARSWVDRGPDVSALRVLVNALQFAGRSEEAAKEAHRILELDGSPVAKGWVARAMTLADRPDEAEALVRPFATADAPGEVLEGLADALEAQGRRRESLEVAARFAQPAKRAWARHVILMGDHDSGPSDRAGWEALKLGVYAGDLAPGAAYLQDRKLFEAAVAHVTARPTPMRTLCEALLAWMQADRTGALEKLRGIEGALSVGGRRHFWRALVAFELDRVDEGEAALDRFERQPYGACWRGWARARLLLLAAEAHARRGDRAKALATLDRLERNLPRADPDFAPLVDARAMRRKLEKEVAVAGQGR
jgi:tetratricopeptide (TPR) repeat protein